MDGWQNVALAFGKLADSGMVPPVAIEPGHKDGWGMAMSDQEQTAMLEIKRQMGSAREASFYRDAIRATGYQPHIFLCHLRKASPGIPVTPANAHPFIKNPWAFIHNGTIYDPETLPRDRSFQLTSDGSDSEYFFCYLLSALSAVSENCRLNALCSAMASLKISYTGANCMLSNGSELFAIRDYMRFGEYLSLYYCPLPKGVVICSEPLELDGLNRDKWHLLPNKSILRVCGTPPAIELSGYNSLT